MAKSAPGWLQRLPIDPSKLTLEELRNFKQADDFLTEPIKGPEGWRYFYGCFKFFLAYSSALYADKRFPAFNRCWDDVRKRFGGDDAFEDGIFVESWVFFDFPFGHQRQTVLDFFSDYINDVTPSHNFQHFIDQMRQSRLGLYQEVLSTKKITKFRELFTGQVIPTMRSVEEYEKGEIFLTRLVEYKGKMLQFGDPKCFPKQYRVALEGNVGGKLFYFDADTTEEQYRRFMKLAGPYWFSCVSADYDSDILSPDHYLTYLRG